MAAWPQNCHAHLEGGVAQKNYLIQKVLECLKTYESTFYMPEKVSAEVVVWTHNNNNKNNNNNNNAELS